MATACIFVGRPTKSPKAATRSSRSDSRAPVPRGQVFARAPGAVRGLTVMAGPSPVRRHAAVDDELAPRHPGRFIGRKVKATHGDIDRLAEASERRRFHPRLAAFVA